MKINKLNSKKKLIDYIDSYNKKFDKIFLISSPVIINLYPFIERLNVEIIICEEGEKCKSINHYKKIIECLVSRGCNKKSLIIGMGGGTITDLSGFVASSYMRGIKHIFIPTTLLCMVDASIGGKTALNFNNIRNLIGTFKEPEEVILYFNFLETLNTNELINGYAEIIKYGLIMDDKLFEFIEKNISSLIISNSNKHIEHIIEKCIEHKIDIVKSDKFDNNIRLILNFGHTVGHALESYYNYRLPHGKAIIYGMKVASYLSYKDKNLTKVDYSRIDFLIKELSLPKLKISDLNKMEKLIKNDKKNINNQLYYITLNKIGKATIENNYNKKKIINALKIL